MAKKMRAAYHEPDAPAAEAIRSPCLQPGQGPPRSGRQLREGLRETLTVNRLGVLPTLASTLRSTNAIESMIEIGRDRATNVSWRDGQVTLGWCGAGMGQAAEQFRRIDEFLHLLAYEPSFRLTPTLLSHRNAMMAK